MPTPALSAVRRWDTGHLIEAADYWTKTATAWEDIFTALATRISLPGGTFWAGEAAETAQHATQSDRMTVIGLADELHSASAIARSGAREIEQARQSVLRIVRVAEIAGFTVGEDFSIIDSRLSDPLAASDRRAEAESLAAKLRASVAVLLSADRGVAARITAATTGLGNQVFPESGRPAAQTADPDPHAKLVLIEASNTKLLDELEREYQQLPDGRVRTDRLADIAGIRKSLTTPDSHLVFVARPEDPSQMIPAAVSVGDPYAAEHISVTVPGVGSTTRKSLPIMTAEIGELVKEAQAITKVTKMPDSVAAIAFMGYQPPLTMTSPEMLDDDLAQAGAQSLRSFLGSLNSAAKPGHTTALFGHSYGSLMSGIALKGGASAMVDNAVLYGSPGFQAAAPADMGLRSEQVFVMSAPDDVIANQIGGLAPLHGWGADPNTVVGDQYLFTHLQTQAATVHFGADSQGRPIEWAKTAANGHSEYGRAATERITGFSLAAILLNRPDWAAKME